MKRNRLILLFSVILLLSQSAKAQIYDTLSKFGASWKYLDTDFNPDSATWKSTTYSDAAWSCGPTPIGYGDTWIITCIQSGCVNDITCAPACGTKNITAWFRQVINVASVTTYDSVIMDGLIDDGLIMYVNGNQIWSYNMPATWNSSTWSNTTISGSAETTLVHQAIPMTHWVTGNNTIAVELHQRGPTSSDLTLDMRFLFRHSGSASTSVNNIPGNNTQFDLYPNPSQGEFIIETKDPTLSSSEVSMTIFDITGRKIAEKPIRFTDSKSNQNLNLARGMYFVNLVSGNANTTFRINIDK